jgi:hypothetical protein
MAVFTVEDLWKTKGRELAASGVKRPRNVRVENTKFVVTEARVGRQAPILTRSPIATCPQPPQSKTPDRHMHSPYPSNASLCFLLAKSQAQFERNSHDPVFIQHVTGPFGSGFNIDTRELKTGKDRVSG